MEIKANKYRRAKQDQYGKLILDVEVLTATTTLTPEDSGKILVLNSATEFNVTLPAVADAMGVFYTFVVRAAPSGASYTITSPANDIVGQTVSPDQGAPTDGDFESSGADVITITDAKAVKGDRVELMCDGTNWFFTAYTSVIDAVTIA
jgi:hypothetical protein